MAHPERLSRRTRGFMRLGAAIAPPALERARRDGEAAAQRIGGLFEQADVLLTPMFTRRPIPIGTYEGRGALWSFNGYSRWVPVLRRRSTTPASPPPRCRWASHPTASRSPSSSSAAPTTRRRCSRSRPRSSRSARGPTGCRILEVTELVALAERIAREAGAQLREAFSGGALATETKSSPTDLVSEADVAAEQLIREALLSARPDDGMLGEEGSDTPGTSGLRWIVDPLDGTTNFLFGIPQWGVSIAVEDESGTLAGVVFDPMRDECWAAERDARADAQRQAAAAAGARGRARDRARRDRLRLRRRRALRAGRGRQPPAPARARHPPRRLVRDRPRVDRGRPLRRVLRARRQAVGHRRRRADLRERRAPHPAARAGAARRGRHPRRPASRSRTSSLHWSTDCDRGLGTGTACSSAQSSCSASCSSSSPSCSRSSRATPSAAVRR